MTNMFDPNLPVGSALALAYELHDHRRITRAEVSVFETALRPAAFAEYELACQAEDRPKGKQPETFVVRADGRG